MNDTSSVEYAIVKVKVHYVALARDLAGSKEEEFELSRPAHVSAAVSKAVEIHPHLARMRQHLRVTVNGNLTDENPELRDGDTVVLLPSIAGG